MIITNQTAHWHILQTIGMKITHPYPQHLLQNFSFREKFISYSRSSFCKSITNKEGSYMWFCVLKCIYINFLLWYETCITIGHNGGWGPIFSCSQDAWPQIYTGSMLQACTAQKLLMHEQTRSCSGLFPHRDHSSKVLLVHTGQQAHIIITFQRTNRICQL